MALLTTATAANRVVDTALRVNYLRRIVFGQWTYVYGIQTITVGSAWEYVRTATKSYRYVGLDEDTAKSLAESLAAYYTRATKISVWNENSDGQFAAIAAGAIPMADVVAQHENGEMWSVVVSVNEQDSRMSRSANESFTTLFYTEDQREYDDGESAPGES